jgi:hypothetical protein
LLRADGVVAVHGGRATVLPPSFRRQIPKYERPLREADVVLHDAPWVDFDPVAGEVVVEPPWPAGIDLDALATELPPTRRPDPVPGAGRYELASWYFVSMAGLEAPMSTADALTTVLSGLGTPLTEAGQAAAVANMFERTTFGRLWFRTPSQLISQIRK